MDRSFEIEPVDGDWKLTLFEDGEEVGGSSGEDEDYSDLYEIGCEFCG